MDSYMNVIARDVLDADLNSRCKIKFTYSAMHGVGYSYMAEAFRTAHFQVNGHNIKSYPTVFIILSPKTIYMLLIQMVDKLHLSLLCLRATDHVYDMRCSYFYFLQRCKSRLIFRNVQKCIKKIKRDSAISGKMYICQLVYLKTCIFILFEDVRVHFQRIIHYILITITTKHCGYIVNTTPSYS